MCTSLNKSFLFCYLIVYILLCIALNHRNKSIPLTMFCLYRRPLKTGVPLKLLIL
ncbi:hypothetical protein HMPREF9446_00679 [Bacteroides fluxus YIT 12057]|uniref:Uncharacterized protein n=1 Tax=Bacteroides fluxus YIT 12057 TaxID=763034 RepID=F3PPM8_9BACE|nr:hypothetical protein HMPREF9446_00679 [Bacteroides fluxus YIT 12057]